MRYEDWDILLFPQNCKVPVKEFKVTCHVVNDSESSQLGGSYGLPTVCCFAPSLVEGTPFQVSIHSWNPPAVSRFTKAYRKARDNVKFEARLFIDGRLVASTALDRKWPHIIAHSFDFSKTGDLETLSFPSFRPELLQQNYWSPADDVGRIKIVLSEGFPRDSLTTPFERVKNIVAFSFQHAPLDILETASLAWPNPAMWRRAPFGASMQVPTLQGDDSESHAHSPRYRGSPSGMLGNVLTSLQGSGVGFPVVAGGRRVTHPVCGPVLYPGPSGLDPFGDAGSYFEWAWLNGMGLGMGSGVGDGQSNNTARSAFALKGTRRTSTDISMPDYVPMKSDSLCSESQYFHGTYTDDDERQATQLKVPTNTPTTADLGYQQDGVPYPMLTDNGAFPPELADSLATSLLNQPLAPNLQQSTCRTPAAEVKSRKENREYHHPLGAGLSTVSGTLSTNLEHQDQRRISQQLYVSSGPNMQAGKEDTEESGNKSHKKYGPDGSHINSLNSLCSAGGNTSMEAHEDEFGHIGGKGTKRTRSLPLLLSRAIDEEDEPRRHSPSVRLTSISEVQGSGNGVA